jgi:thiol-disulfide isomerase/thioredoxin
MEAKTMLRRKALSMCLTPVILAGLNGAPRKNAKAELNLTDLDGKRVQLKDYHGRVVVLNFWATWCGPCKEEMPLLVAAEKAYKARGVVFIGASLDEPKTRRRVPEFATQYQIGFPVWLGATADDLARLDMGEAVPATAFIDQDGSIIARVSGEIREAELKERIEWLLGDRTGPAPLAMVKHLD